jgi:hypothetical protein
MSCGLILLCIYASLAPFWSAGLMHENPCCITSKRRPSAPSTIGGRVFSTGQSGDQLLFHLFLVRGRLTRDVEVLRETDDKAL